MKRTINHVLSTCLLIVMTGSIPLCIPAAEKSTAATEVSSPEKKVAPHPFRGKVSAVDKAALTISLEGREKARIIHLTSQTRIAKAGKTATLADAAIGEEVAGQAIKAANGHEEAVSLRFGAKEEPKAEVKKETKAKKETK
jgi:hypothetical protein